MASKMTLTFAANDELSAQLVKYNEKLDQLTQKINTTSKAGQGMEKALDFAKVAAAGAAAFAVVNAAAERAYQVVTAFEDAGARVQGQLIATGNAAGISSGALRVLADETSRQTRLTTGQVQKMESLLLIYDKIGGEAYPRILKTAAGMGSVFGNVEEGVKKLGKILQNPVEEINALNEVGIRFSKDFQAGIISMVASGDRLGAMNKILDQLDAKFGGLAETVGKTTASSFDKMAAASERSIDAIARGWVQKLGPMFQWAAEKLDSMAAVDEIANITDAQKTATTRLFAVMEQYKGADNAGVKQGLAAQIQAQAAALEKSGYSIPRIISSLTLLNDNVKRDYEKTTDPAQRASMEYLMKFREGWISRLSEVEDLNKAAIKKQADNTAAQKAADEAEMKQAAEAAARLAAAKASPTYGVSAGADLEDARNEHLAQALDARRRIIASRYAQFGSIEEELQEKRRRAFVAYVGPQAQASLGEMLKSAADSLTSALASVAPAFESAGRLFSTASRQAKDDADRQAEAQAKAFSEWTGQEQDKINLAKAAGQDTLAMEQDFIAAKWAKQRAIDQAAKEAKRKAFDQDKLAQVAEATGATALGVAKSLPNIPLSIVVGALGAANIALIAGQANPYWTGGIVPGGSSIGDRVPAMVNSGEMILTSAQQSTLFAMANGAGGGGGGQVVNNYFIVERAYGTVDKEFVIGLFREKARLDKDFVRAS